MINVLYITAESGKPIGSALSLKDLIVSVQKEVKPFVVVRTETAAIFFRQFGYTTFVVNYPLDITSSKGIKRAVQFIPRLVRDCIQVERSLHQLERICTDNHIEIIHSNNSVVDIGYMLSKKVHKPHVWHLREFLDLGFGWNPFLGWQRLINYLLRSDCTISITKAIRKHYKLEGHKNAIQAFDAVRSIDDITCDKNKEKFFMLCGNISPTKGADTAVRAFGEFCKTNNDYTLKFVGTVSDSYKQELLDIASQYGVQSKIVFEGYQSDTKRYYTKATAYLMCSKHEAQGRVTVEAMFYGCPVIGYNGGGTKEIIEDGVNGYLFKTIKDCATCMRNVIANHNISTIIENAHEKARKDFSIENYGEKIIDIYKNLLNSK